MKQQANFVFLVLRLLSIRSFGQSPVDKNWTFDDVKVFEFTNEGTGYKTWPFDKPFHILLNLAVGGNWGGTKGIDNAIFPQQFVIDYVRYYKMIDK